MKKSARVALVLVGSLAVGSLGTACSSQQSRSTYRTYQDCRADNPNADCDAEVSNGRPVFYGPWMSGSKVRSPRSTGSEVRRGGFGGRGSSVTSGS